MAILVAVGGAALGTALGVGPGAGWLAGAALGNLLFPGQGPDSRVEGSRLGDLTVTSSAYGAPIAIAYGTLRMAGNMIWSSGIQERQNITRIRSGGKGGGGSTQTSVSYAYFASFALSFGEGPAEDVLRIWADGKLIHDKTGASPEIAKPSLRFLFHPGSETQLPDPLIEAHVGVSRAPAHRGLCLIVFEDSHSPTSATASQHHRRDHLSAGRAAGGQAARARQRRLHGPRRRLRPRNAEREVRLAAACHHALPQPGEPRAGARP
jgi:hypothetical protein